MKSLVIAVGRKIIVSLNCLKADKAQLNTMHFKKEQLPALIIRATPSTANSLAKFSYVQRTNIGALQSSHIA